jgi:hypothetical protein
MVTLALIVVPAKTLLAIIGFAVRAIYRGKQFPINTQHYKHNNVICMHDRNENKH